MQTVSSKGLTHWLAEIKVTFSTGRAGALRLARVVLEAKRALPYGQWTEIWRSGLLPFSKRKGEMLAVIGQSLRRHIFGKPLYDRNADFSLPLQVKTCTPLAGEVPNIYLGSLDAHNCAHRPASWNALYYLARIERAVLLRLIADGAVHPTMKREEAKGLLTPECARTNRQRSALSAKRWLLRMANFVRRKLSDWTPTLRQMASLELAAIAEKLSNKPSERFREYHLSSSDSQSSNRLFPSTTTL